VRILYIRPRFQPEIHSSSASSRRHIYKNYSSRHQERLAASITRKTEQQQYQEGPVSPQHIKTDRQFRIRSNLSATTKRSRIVGDSLEGSNNVFWHPNITTPNEGRGLPCCQLMSILHEPGQFSARTSHLITHWYSHRSYSWPDRAAICPSSTAAQVHCPSPWSRQLEVDHNSEARRNYPNVSLRNYYATTVRHWPNKYHMCFTVIVN